MKTRNKDPSIIYICSPYSGDTARGTEMAKRYSRYAVDRGFVPVTPHLYLPLFLSEKTERELAISLDLRLLDMPHVHDPGSGEDRILERMKEIDVLKERYRQAMEYMDWFQPAWDQLSEDERYVLETFYGHENTYGSSAVHYIAEYFRIEQSSAYKRKNRALDHLTLLLFGKA